MSSWEEAWSRAEPLMAGVRRARVRGSAPGVELATLDWGGDGDLVVIHHANGFCAATYAPIAHALRGRFRVVSVDARGHGDSTFVDPDDDPQAYAWSRMAADYACVLDRLLLETGRSRVRLAIGHSFGGVLTLVASAARPGVVEEALLLDPVVLPPVSERDGGSDRGPDLAALARKRRSVFDSRAEAFSHCRGRGLFADFRPEALALYVAEGMARTPDGEVRLKCAPGVEAAVFESGRGMDVFDYAPEIATRTRILHARRGNFSRDVYARLASRMADAEVASLDVGHLLAMEAPEIVIDEVERMIDEYPFTRFDGRSRRSSTARTGGKESAFMSDALEHPSAFRPETHAVFNPAKMGKATLFESDRMLVGLNSFEPGQEHALHAHEGMDKVYQVLSGTGRFLLEATEQVMSPGTMLVAPSGVPHGIRNDGAERLVVLAILAPGPGAS